jgi:predicted nucleic acid-binding protein
VRTLFLDTSALVRLYDRREPGAPRLVRLCRPGGGHRLLIARLARVELASAFQRKLRTGEMPAAAALRALGRFERQRNERYQERQLDDAALDLATQLLTRHTLRAYDAVQLANAILAGRELAVLEVDLRFITADRNQAAAAVAEGLDVELVA